MSIETKLKKTFSPSSDYIFKTLKIKNQEILLVYNETLVNTVKINDYILKRLVAAEKKDLKNLINYLPSVNLKEIAEKEMISSLLKSCLLIITKKKIYSAELKTNLDRSISPIESELSLTGPKDSFTENYNTNIGLIRKRLKSKNLLVENIELGLSTKTKIGVLYMSNIADSKLKDAVISKLKNINIDGIIDSSYLKKALEKKYTLFPTIITTERPDKTCMALLEGKIVILVDMSPYVIILPSFLIDFFHTTDDYYQKSPNASFIRIIRLFAFLVSLFTPAIYIAVTTRNYNLIPLDLLMTLKAGRTFVPFPAYIEALFMIICFEILKESDLRMSSTTGSAISILGGLILGDAAVSAGIVSPIMIIVIAISSIASLTFQSVELGNALRNYKIILLLLATLFGINGLLVGTTILIYQLVTLKVFGLSYLIPFIPYEKNEINDSLLKLDTKTNKRNSYLTKNIDRGNYI